VWSTKRPTERSGASEDVLSGVGAAVRHVGLLTVAYKDALQEGKDWVGN
jgi:hypothetical protein